MGAALIHKHYNLQLKSVEASGVISGVASTYGNVDLDGEVIDPDAFGESVRQTKGIVPVLWSHDTKTPIGWGVSATSTSSSLTVAGKLMLNTEAGQKVHSFCRMALNVGGKVGLSPGFQVRPGDAYFKDGVKHFRRAILREWSVCLFPANPEASVTAAKQVRSLALPGSEDLMTIAALRKLSSRMDEIVRGARSNRAFAISRARMTGYQGRKY